MAISRHLESNISNEKIDEKGFPEGLTGAAKDIFIHAFNFPKEP